MFRKDLENIAFEEWKNSEGDERIAYEIDLRELLTAHAQAVQFAILRRVEDNLVVEAVDRVMMKLDTFLGESLFTTWAHRILMGVMHDQRRLDRKNKETSIDVPDFDLASDMTLGIVDIVLTVQKLLDADDYKIFDELCLKGNSQEEAGENLKMPQQTLSRKWNRIMQVLKDGLTK